MIRNLNCKLQNPTPAEVRTYPSANDLVDKYEDYRATLFKS